MVGRIPRAAQFNVEDFSLHETPEGPKYLCTICPHPRMTTNPAKHARGPTHVLMVQHIEARRITTMNQLVEMNLQPQIGAQGDLQQHQNNEEQARRDSEAAQMWATIDGLIDLHARPQGVRPLLEDELDTQEDGHSNSCWPRSQQQENEPTATLDWDELLEQEINNVRLAGDPLEADDDAEPDPPMDASVNNPKENIWYPFKDKEDLVGSLLVGHTHSMLSRSLYSKIRGILELYDIELPAWATVQRSRTRIQKTLGSKVRVNMSVFDTPTFSLSAAEIISQDLANPLVSKHLDFYPEQTDGVDVFKLSQSNKWLKHLSPTHQPQMCEVDGKHFYIFEPVRLFSGVMVIPIYFYIYQGCLFSKCFELAEENVFQTESECKITIPPNLEFDNIELISTPVSNFNLNCLNIWTASGTPLLEACGGKIYECGLETPIEIPNPWRKTADGKIIRNVPITLYADDTSGNLSKQFNKHIGCYFTLSGLPPKISNQEYHCHYLSASNLAGVLEISEQIVNELNGMATDGFTAYDYSLSQEVLVNSVVLCFVGDSPMHAKITNTPNPGQALNPCRMCTLSSTTRELKQTSEFVKKFLHLDAQGNEMPVAARIWSTTYAHSYSLYNIAMTLSDTQFKIYSKVYGIKDQINIRFIQDSKKIPALMWKMRHFDLHDPTRLYNPYLKLSGFDGVHDTPVEVLHVILLGVAKYVARDAVGKLTGQQKSEVKARLRSFNRNSLNIDSLKPDYLVQHIKSLVGRDIKILLQAA
ncbi:hypothetical protein PTTG_02584, partial [Puccinia triticina 1-1 BBBD Race 1]